MNIDRSKMELDFIAIDEKLQNNNETSTDQNNNNELTETAELRNLSSFYSREKTYMVDSIIGSKKKELKEVLQIEASLKSDAIRISKMIKTAPIIAELEQEIKPLAKKMKLLRALQKYNNNNFCIIAVHTKLKERITTTGRPVADITSKINRLKQLKNIKYNTLKILIIEHELQGNTLAIDNGLYKMLQIAITEVDNVEGWKHQLQLDIVNLKKANKETSSLLTFRNHTELEGTIYNGFDNYIKYKLVRQPKHNYKNFCLVYDVEVNDLRQVVNLALLNSNKKSIKKSFVSYDKQFKLLLIKEYNLTIKEIDNMIENNVDFCLFDTNENRPLMSFVSNTLRTVLKKYCLSISSIVTLKQSNLETVKQSILNRISKIKQLTNNNNVSNYLEKQNYTISQRNAKRTDGELINQEVTKKDSINTPYKILVRNLEKDYLFLAKKQESSYKINIDWVDFPLLEMRYKDGLSILEIAGLCNCSTQRINRELNKEKLRVGKPIEKANQRAMMEDYSNYSMLNLFR